MKYIYRIQHRDLKPENILMYKPNWFGVSDFGTSRIKFESLHSLRGATLRYNKKGLFDSNIGKPIFFYLKKEKFFFFLIKKKIK
jgi:serine/threonine protein kinase